MKYVINHMPGDRTTGYYFIQIDGTNFILCQNGHPDFPVRFWDSDKDAKINAQTYIDKVLKS